MRLSEITNDNKFTAFLDGVDLNKLDTTLHIDFKEVSNLYIKIMHRKIPNYAHMSQPFIEKVKNKINKFLNRINILPDQDDTDLINIIINAKQILSKIDDMQQAMKTANLIK